MRRLCDIDVSCPKVNAVCDKFFSKAIKLSQQQSAQGVGEDDRLGDAQVGDVYSLLHEYLDSIEEVVGTVTTSYGGYPYGDPDQDREEMALALGAVSAMAGRRASLLRSDALRRGFDSLEVTQAIEHLQTSYPRFSPSTVADVEQEFNRQVTGLGDEVAKLRRNLTTKRRCSIKEFWQQRS